MKFTSFKVEDFFGNVISKDSISPDKELNLVIV